MMVLGLIDLLSVFRCAEGLKNDTRIVIHHPLCILTAKTC